MLQNMEQTLGLENGELNFLETLGSDQVSELESLFAQAQANQRQQTNLAIESGLQIVPAFLRKAVRKVLGDS